MRSFMATLLVAVAALAAHPEPGLAKGIPNATLSTVTKPMVACPAGDLMFTTILHNLVDLPCDFADVVISFEDCPSVHFPPVVGDEGYQVTLDPGTQALQTLQKVSDVSGEADFAIRAGGGCPGSTVRIYGNGVLVAIRALASPDQDGNLGVGPEDVALATAKLGTSDPTADFNGDGTVTNADLDILRAHLGHHAPGMATPVASHTWGTLKLLYR